MVAPEDKFLINLGLRIKDLREAKGLSQENFAIDCEVPKSQISRIEKAKVNTTVKTLIKIAAALGLEPKDLLDFNKQ